MTTRLQLCNMLLNELIRNRGRIKFNKFYALDRFRDSLKNGDKEQILYNLILLRSWIKCYFPEDQEISFALEMIKDELFNRKAWTKLEEINKLAVV